MGDSGLLRQRGVGYTYNIHTSCILTGYWLTALLSFQALRLSNRARQNSTVGEIVNLMSVDAQRLNDLVTYLHSIWAAPFQIVLALIFLWFSMGPSIFAGFAIMVLLIPINIVVAAMNRKYQVMTLVMLRCSAVCTCVFPCTCIYGVSCNIQGRVCVVL